MSYNSKKKDKNKVVEELWELFDILRHYNVKNQDHFGLLYLLFIFTEKLDINFETGEPIGNLTHLRLHLPKIHYENLYMFDYDEIEQIHNVFKPVLERWAPGAVIKVLHLLGDINRKTVEDNFPEIFDSFLYGLSKAQSRDIGQNVLPPELSHFISKSVTLPENAVIYNPFAGFASFGIFLNDNSKYFGQEINQNIWAVGMLRLIAHKKDKNFTFTKDDSIENWNPTNEKFDLIIANPPFNLKLSSYFRFEAGSPYLESFLIKKGLEDLKQDGKLVLLLAEGVLFSGGSHKKWRKKLIEQDLVDTVVSFPTGIFYHTSVKTSLVILSKAKKEKGKVRFVNAEEFIKKINRVVIWENEKLENLLKDSNFGQRLQYVDNSRIALEDFNLIAHRYLMPELDESKDDGEKVQLIRALEPVKKERVLAGTIGAFVRIRDLQDDRIDFKLKPDDIKITDIPKHSSKIAESCILIAGVGNKLKPTFFEFLGKPIFLSNNVYPFRLKENKINVNFLVNTLYSDLVLNQLLGYSSGSSIPFLNKKDFLRIRINLPSLENQRKSAQTVLEAVEAEKKKELNLFRRIHGLESELTQQNSYLRHSLAAPASNLYDAVDNIKRIIEEKISPQFPEVMELKVSDKHLSTLREYIEDSLADSARVFEAVSKRINIEREIASKKKVPINLYNFVDKFVKKFVQHSNVEFQIKFQADKISFQNSKGKNESIIIFSNQDLLKDLFHNLIDNAIRHGFSNKFENNRIEIFIKPLNDPELPKVQILFSNTGNTLPENFSKEDFVRKGGRYGENAGDGFGGWYINEIVKYHEGSDFLIINEIELERIPGKDLVTTFEFNFPLIISKT